MIASTDPLSLSAGQNTLLLQTIFTALEVTTSLRSAASLFPEHTALEPGEISASVTVNAFMAAMEKHLNTLLDLSNGEHAIQANVGGAS
jgi:hypothetical protein